MFVLEKKLYSAVASLWHSASRVSNSPCQLVWNRLKSKAQNYRMPTFTRRDMFLLWLQHGRLWIHGQLWQISQWCRDGTLSPFQAVVILSIKSRIGSFQKTRNICQSNLTTMEWIKLKQLGGELEFTMKCIDVESKLLHLHQICRAWSLQSWTEYSISEYTITRNLFRIIMVGLLRVVDANLLHSLSNTGPRYLNQSDWKGQTTCSSPEDHPLPHLSKIVNDDLVSKLQTVCLTLSLVKQEQTPPGSEGAWSFCFCPWLKAFDIHKQLTDRLLLPTWLETAR